MPERPKTAKELRDSKLAEALRANLKRRKAKERAQNPAETGADKAAKPPRRGPGTARKPL